MGDRRHILIINHTIVNCGVYQYGKRLSNILIDSRRIRFSYCEISSLDMYQDMCQNLDVDAIMYNYHPATLPWLNNTTIQRKTPNICLHHDGDVIISFDHVIELDATDQINSIPRPLLTYEGINSQNESQVPVIGSFGFGFNSKGFDRLIQLVNDQFDQAIIRLNITFAYFGDDTGDLGRSIANRCNVIPRKEGIKLIITHDFMDDQELLAWLNGNTINIFFYQQHYAAGCSSAIDYALSANRPIGISDSKMFRHIYSDAISIFVTPIRDIIKNGNEYLEKFRQAWSHDKLIEKVEKYIFQETIILPIWKNNTVLNDNYRALLEPSIKELFTLVPDMMERKIARANVQQAFVFEYIKDNFDMGQSIICVGSHEDTCCAALKKLGYSIAEIDPVHNSDLHTYCMNNSYPNFDVVFSISVINHVPNDNEFIDDMCKLLKSGGTCIFTCDFSESESKILGCDHRFYAESDMLIRFKQILDSNDCYIDGEIDYRSIPDFIYNEILYTFGTMIFKKHNLKMMITLNQLHVPDDRSFHGSVIPYQDKYICIYHNSEQHDLGSCFIEKDELSTFKYIDGTHTEDLKISKYIDPRIINYQDSYYVSMSRLLDGPETIYLFRLIISDDKITIDKNFSINFPNIRNWSGYIKSIERNWTPWEHKGNFLYTYSCNPHIILEVEGFEVKVVAHTNWKTNSWWENQSWEEPKYRLNCPPILLSDGSYLSVFHTMKICKLATKWHKIIPNEVRGYYMGFFQFEGIYPFKVIKISSYPFITPHHILPDNWPFHPPPSGGNPFYPFSMILDDDKIQLFGGSNEIAIAYCTLSLQEVLDSLCLVQNDE